MPKLEKPKPDWLNLARISCVEFRLRISLGLRISVIGCRVSVQWQFHIAGCEDFLYFPLVVETHDEVAVFRAQLHGLQIAEVEVIVVIWRVIFDEPGEQPVGNRYLAVQVDLPRNSFNQRGDLHDAAGDAGKKRVRQLLTIDNDGQQRLAGMRAAASAENPCIRIRWPI